MADPATTPSARSDTELEQLRVRRTELKDRHAQALSRLLLARADLRGVHALADLVSDSLRWSA